MLQSGTLGKLFQEAEAATMPMNLIRSEEWESDTLPPVFYSPLTNSLQEDAPMECNSSFPHPLDNGIHWKEMWGGGERPLMSYFSSSDIMAPHPEGPARQFLLGSRAPVPE
jgi:hypothetical protein